MTAWVKVQVCAAIFIGVQCPQSLALEPREIFSAASRSVVVVKARTKAGSFAQGSGVVVASGFVATNCHVVAGASWTQVQAGGLTANAVVWRRDDSHDVCLLKAELPGLVAVRVADLRYLKTGARVYSIGSPRGLELTISEGLVSGRRMTPNGEVFQTSAPISPGSSGGGLFDEDARLVGLTTFTLTNGQNLNFAVPASIAMDLAEAREEESLPVMGHEGLTELSGAVATGISKYDSEQKGPKPAFSNPIGASRFHEWLAKSGERLEGRISERQTRIEFLEALWYESTRAGLEPALVLSLVETTSNFKKYAISSSGDRGYMQISPRWAKTIGDGDTAKLFHMQTNLRFGCVILRHYLDTNHGDLSMALSAFHAQAEGWGEPERTKSDPRFTNAVFANRKHWLV